MKYYKDPNTNEVYAYESDGSQDEYIKNGLKAITKAEADEIRLNISINAFNALTYSEKRATEYPPITDYLDGIVKGDKTQVQAYIDACLAVKEKYPKGVE